MLKDWKQFFPLSRRQRKRFRSNSSSSTDGDDTGAGDSSAARDGSAEVPLDTSSSDSTQDEDTLPPVVEVLIGGLCDVATVRWWH